MRYLASQCRGHRAQIDDLKHEAFYWNWWKEQWYQRDEEFIAYHQLSHVSTDARKADNVHFSYTYFHQKAMNDENLSKSYMYLMTSTQKIWRAKL